MSNRQIEIRFMWWSSIRFDLIESSDYVTKNKLRKINALKLTRKAKTKNFKDSKVNRGIDKAERKKTIQAKWMQIVYWKNAATLATINWWCWACLVWSTFSHPYTTTHKRSSVSFRCTGKWLHAILHYLPSVLDLDHAIQSSDS